MPDRLQQKHIDAVLLVVRQVEPMLYEHYLYDQKGPHPVPSLSLDAYL
ncbi:MAG: hypothetical protein HQK88_11895 [Nitrospirae bacterium]|nr:hypothetical protein [Nitrospirota bacterium]